MNTRRKSFREIKDLIAAYHYAMTANINYRSLLAVHRIVGRTVLGENKQYLGKIRDKEVGVYEDGHKLVYQGCPADECRDELKKLLADIEQLKKSKPTHEQVFYFASMIHLRFVQIHPFADGNGRMARLLEKWVLSKFIGNVAWVIETEKYYQKNLKNYYKNINLGASYHQLDYDLCLDFLLMLPGALRFSV